MVLNCASEKGLSFVVRDVRPRVRLGDAEVGQEKRQCLGCHGRPAISVQAQLAWLDVLALAALGHEYKRCLPSLEERLISTNGIPTTLPLACERFRDAAVVFVHGNHEFYGSDRNFGVAITKQAQAENPNLVWLDNSGIQLSGFNPSTSSSPIPGTPSSSGAARHGPVICGAATSLAPHPRVAPITLSSSTF